MTTNLDNISYVKDQLLLNTTRHWYVYILDSYKVYQHINNDNTDNRLLVPLTFKFNFLKDLSLLYSSEILKLKASNGNVFTNN